jgi:hypothetical protein
VPERHRGSPVNGGFRFNRKPPHWNETSIYNREMHIEPCFARHDGAQNHQHRLLPALQSAQSFTQLAERHSNAPPSPPSPPSAPPKPSSAATLPRASLPPSVQCHPETSRTPTFQRSTRLRGRSCAALSPHTNGEWTVCTGDDFISQCASSRRR